MISIHYFLIDVFVLNSYFIVGYSPDDDAST